MYPAEDKVSGRAWNLDKTFVTSKFKEFTVWRSFNSLIKSRELEADLKKPFTSISQTSALKISTNL